jgi:aldose 1-epimerase
MPEMVGRRTFGHLDDGTAVDLITIQHAGLELSAMTYGAVIVSLTAPDTHGRAANVVLGYDRLEPYLESSPYFGAFVGRVANRIANARFSIDGRVHNLSANEPPHHLHGGFRGFDKRVWEAETSGHLNAVVLRRRSVDGEEGYPGALDIELTYSIGDDGDVWMKCEAITDAPTHVNVTQHTYFNLRGSGDVLDHHLTINASVYLPVDRQLIPTGALAPVANTPFDFREGAEIGARLQTGHEQLKIGGGYDHTYVLDGGSAGVVRAAARVFDSSSGRAFQVSTSEPGLQFYSGQAVGHRGFCLEPQHFPDSPNRPEFPSTLLRPGERYRTMTCYLFDV